jgi:hypothetical protein
MANVTPDQIRRLNALTPGPNKGKLGNELEKLVNEHNNQKYFVTPKMYGCIGVGDETEKIQALFNSDAPNIIFDENKDYTISSKIIDTKGHCVDMCKASLVASTSLTREVLVPSEPSNIMTDYAPTQFMFEVDLSSVSRSNQRRFEYKMTLNGSHKISGLNTKQSVGNIFRITCFNTVVAIVHSACRPLGSGT